MSNPGNPYRNKSPHYDDDLPTSGGRKIPPKAVQLIVLFSACAVALFILLLFKGWLGHIPR